MSTLPLLGRVSNLGRLPIHGRPDYWTTLGRIQSGMVLDFTSATISDTLAARGFTFTRSGATATRVNSSGVLETVAANTLRIDHDPTTLACLGGLFEEASTNAIRNSTMVGVVTGSPGTLPTNWSLAPAGLTQTVVGAGVESGVPYVDVRLSGTTTSALARFLFDANTAIAASASQAWTQSVYMRLVGGSLANVNSISPGIVYRDAGGTSLASGDTAASVTTDALIVQRRMHTSTSPASTSYAQGSVNLSVVNGAAVDITLRIGAPQLEQKAFATSYIPTSTAAVTRNADALTLSDLTRIGYSASAGTLVAQGVINGQSASVYPALAALGMGASATDEMLLYRNAANNRFVFDSKVANVTQFSASNTTTVAVGTAYKTAAAWAVNDAAHTTSGASPATDTSGSLSTIIDRMSIGGYQARGGGTTGVQTISRIEYYPRRLSNAELQSITT